MGKGEFERIETYFAPLAADFAGALGLLDDAAILSPGPDQSVVVTTDTIVEGVHYIGDEAPDLIARKLLRVNLSDLASMGAVPYAYTLNVAFPHSVSDDWLEAFAAGLRADQREFAVHLAGGDSVSTRGPTVLTVTMYGLLPRGSEVRRSGAAVGDWVFVSGTLGDGALGLKVAAGELALDDERDSAELADRYRLPRPRTALGARLRGVASAMADISDGFLADLGHIVEASGVGATVDLEDIPLSRPAAALIERDPKWWETVLSGGDDYELVFTCKDPSAIERVSIETGMALTCVGRIDAEASVVVRDGDGQRVRFAKLGYRHN